ncbi:hypothetical protein GALL_387370 [mine drainage metagenome]|uniref:Uncharacterized protein n=1 Tax=mine drainage metagenome TaxID=410659 RepID=A0A1J5Q783_9ZZZZ
MDDGSPIRAPVYRPSKGIQRCHGRVAAAGSALNISLRSAAVKYARCTLSASMLRISGAGQYMRFLSADQATKDRTNDRSRLTVVSATFSPRGIIHFASTTSSVSPAISKSAPTAATRSRSVDIAIFFDFSACFDFASASFSYLPTASLMHTDCSAGNVGAGAVGMTDCIARNASIARLWSSSLPSVCNSMPTAVCLMEYVFILSQSTATAPRPKALIVAPN